VRAELIKRLDVKRPGVRAGGHDRNTAPEYFGSMSVQTDRCEGATAEKGVLFPSDRPLIPNSLLFLCLVTQ
jgi:hypothetical protein